MIVLIGGPWCCSIGPMCAAARLLSDVLVNLLSAECSKWLHKIYTADSLVLLIGC
jgi:hypothetical protein